MVMRRSKWKCYDKQPEIGKASDLSSKGTLCHWHGVQAIDPPAAQREYELWEES